MMNSFTKIDRVSKGVPGLGLASRSNQIIDALNRYRNGSIVPNGAGRFENKANGSVVDLTDITEKIFGGNPNDFISTLTNLETKIADAEARHAAVSARISAVESRIAQHKTSGYIGIYPMPYFKRNLWFRFGRYEESGLPDIDNEKGRINLTTHSGTLFGVVSGGSIGGEASDFRVWSTDQNGVGIGFESGIIGGYSTNHIPALADGWGSFKYQMSDGKTTYDFTFSSRLGEDNKYRIDWEVSTAAPTQVIDLYL